LRPGAWGSLRHLICVNAWQNPALEGLAVNGLVDADIHGNAPKGRLLYLPARLARRAEPLALLAKRQTRRSLVLKAREVTI
jgi:hypothetical protein